MFSDDVRIVLILRIFYISLKNRKKTEVIFFHSFLFFLRYFVVVSKLLPFVMFIKVKVYFVDVAGKYASQHLW